MRLSFSSVDCYLTCPRKYKIERVDRITTIRKGSPLSFGGAIDSGAEFYLLNKDDACARPKSLQAFENEMRKEHAEHDIRYSQADVQLELIDAEALLDSLGFEIEPKEFLKYCKENPAKLDEDETAALKAIQIEAIVAKGKMMLPLFFDWVDENVETVHSCQRKIEITNELGDTFVGYEDFDVTLKNGKRYTYDMKTSSNPKAHYPPSAASESMQLGIYSEVGGNPLVGYFVLDKGIRKREPRARSLDVRGEITEEFLDETFDTIEEVRKAIIAEEFHKNTNSCFRFGRCDFYDLCRHGSMKGLKKK